MTALCSFVSVPPQRGGSRNSAVRVSFGLTYAQSRLIRASAAYAVEVGMALNRHTTFNLSQLGVAPDRGAPAVTRVTKLLREWLAKRGSTTAFLWVREGKGGSHVHLVWHLPPGVPIKRRTRAWACILAGGRAPSGSVFTTTIRGWSATTREQSALYWANLNSLVTYILKGWHDDAMALLRSEGAGSGGEVIGKRCGTSNNLGATARRQLQPTADDTAYRQ